jgi:hypothetical protein
MINNQNDSLNFRKRKKNGERLQQAVAHTPIEQSVRKKEGYKIVAQQVAMMVMPCHTR